MCDRSATPAGQNIPWHLVLEKAGWRSRDGQPPLVVLVPGLAMLLFDAETTPSGSRWHNVIDYWKSYKGMIKDLDDWDAIQVLDRMPSRATGAPLVVGNPAIDLPDAEDEAAGVADILDVKPLVGGSATVDAVSDALSEASLVHLATHALFDPTSPLDSQVRLADGELSVRDLRKR
jgi:hypothetical protein